MQTPENIITVDSDDQCSRTSQKKRQPTSSCSSSKHILPPEKFEKNRNGIKSRPHDYLQETEEQMKAITKYRW